MKKDKMFAAKTPGELKRRINREKLEERMAAHGLRRAIREAAGFHSWRCIKIGLK